MTVVAGFALLAVLIAAFVPPSMGADAVSGDECTLFVDWENYNLPEFDEEARAHQYFVAPHPLAQQPGNWQFVQVVWADGDNTPTLRADGRSSTTKRTIHLVRPTNDARLL